MQILDICKGLPGRMLISGVLLACSTAHAATFVTFVDDQPGYLAAIGAGTVTTNEDFSGSVDQQPIGAAGTPDIWTGFTVEAYGPNNASTYSPSRYCQALNQGTCIYWNGAVPAVPGVYGAVTSGFGVSFKPTSPTIAGMSFDFVDWNDGGLRSELVLLASDGSTTTVSGSANPSGAPPQTFGVTLSPADIAAGIYITEMRWVGLTANDEVVGFYNVRTYTNPVITNVPPVANPDAYTGLLGTPPIALSLLVNDTDPDGDALQVTQINGVALTPGVAQSIPVPNGTVDVSASGSFAFIPNSGFVGTSNFEYAISDGRGGTAVSTVSVQINPLPVDPPIDPVATVQPVPLGGGWVTMLLSTLLLGGAGLHLRRKQAQSIGVRD